MKNEGDISRTDCMYVKFFFTSISITSYELLPHSLLCELQKLHESRLTLPVTQRELRLNCEPPGVETPRISNRFEIIVGQSPDRLHPTLPRTDPCHIMA